MYSSLNTFTSIRDALGMFKKNLDTYLQSQLRKKIEGLGLSVGKAEIPGSVRFAKYEVSNFWQQFKLEQKKSSICGVSQGFFIIFLLTRVPMPVE